MHGKERFCDKNLMLCIGRKQVAVKTTAHCSSLYHNSLTHSISLNLFSAGSFHITNRERWWRSWWCEKNSPQKFVGGSLTHKHLLGWWRARLITKKWQCYDYFLKEIPTGCFEGHNPLSHASLLYKDAHPFSSPFICSLCARGPFSHKVATWARFSFSANAHSLMAAESTTSAHTQRCAAKRGMKENWK